MDIKPKHVNDTSMQDSPLGHGGTSWERKGEPDPIQVLCPCTKLRDFRPLDPYDPTPSPSGRAPDTGSGTTGHGGVPPLLQMAWHGGQRGANKKLTKVYCPLRKRSPKRLIVTVEPKTSTIFYITTSLGPLLQ